MTPEEFSRVGRILWGPRWRYRAAQELGVAERDVSRWADGAAAVPPPRVEEMLALAKRQASRIEDAVRLLAEDGSPRG